MQQNKRSRHSGPLIKLADYARIHAILRAVMDGVDANTTKACIFFSVAGAYLLSKHHRLDARPIAGAAFYCVGGDPPNALSYARFEDGEVVSDDDAFHCWVECDGWAIDFMAPLFGAAFDQMQSGLKVPARMFQRPLDTMSSTIDLRSAGEFLLLPNLELTAAVMARALRKPAAGDLAEICAHWYRPTPKRVEGRLTIGSDDGSLRSLQMKLPQLSGAW
jgi:hypothetical protein